MFQRIFKRGVINNINKSNYLINPIRKNFQLQVLRENIPIIFFKDDLFVQTIKQEQLEIEQEPTKRRLVIPDNEFSFLNKLEMESIHRMNECFANKPKIPIKKQIMTPNGIRTEKLVIQGPPPNEFATLDKIARISYEKMNKALSHRN